MKNLILLFLGAFLLAASCDRDKLSENSLGPHYTMMFYNVENLFDTEDDPLIDDQEFLPGSEKKWTRDRYQEKLDHITRVIRDLGGDTLPVLVGLCEVENRKVVDDLVGKTSLKGMGYRVVHQESPDSRGIDVALLYRSSNFTLTGSRFIGIGYPVDTAFRTRDILYVTGIMAGIDTLHVFVSHWPSRSGGEVQTRPLRKFVAETIRKAVDSIRLSSPAARIIICGDFNDEPEDLSVVSGLRALLSAEKPVTGELYDLTPGLRNGNPGGTYKYKGNWNLLDHMVVSGSLLDTSRVVFTRPRGIGAFHTDYLLEADPDNLGVRPLRTYLGSFYQGGYSDHLPVYLHLYYR